ncbi:hypothetical protein PVAG01_01475 [Phlyctema vagabunda]|uniref:Uncharacterized protein n=1 Tax=Phlyctema vagabunda TaxID=108571 RepID=A0ABR4PX94_9HELO
MLRPTQSLRFRSLPALQTLLAPPPPLPLNRQESQKLLNLLTTSFREQLARDVNDPSFHLPPRPEASAPHKHLKHGNRTRLRRKSDGSSGTIDRHLESLLTNPLFSRPAKQEKRSPMATFDMAVANGQMKIPYAKGCLVALKRTIIESPELSVRDAMKESGAGLKVLKWLKASGAMDDKKFLSDRPFMVILLEFMVAEDLQEVAWEWIYPLMESHRTLPSGHREAIYLEIRQVSSLLSALMRAEMAGSATLDNAFVCLARAAAYMNTPRPTPQRSVLYGPCQLLVRSILQEDAPKLSSSALYDDLLVLAPELSSRTLVHARLCLRHPSSPSADLAIVHFRKGYNRVDLPFQGQARSRQENIILGIEAAHFLLGANDLKGATWLMETLQREYPAELQSLEHKSLEQKSPEHKSPREEELLNIKMLESLDLA